MNERGHYGTWVGEVNDQPPPASLKLPKGDPRGSIEDIRKEAARIASQQSTFPQTRSVIVIMTAPGREWSSQSFDSVEGADMSMTWDLAGDLRREGKTTYVAYFEKGTNKLLFDWDFWRDGGTWDPKRWQKPKPGKPSTDNTAKLIIAGLGITAVIGIALHHKSEQDQFAKALEEKLARRRS